MTARPARTRSGGMSPWPAERPAPESILAIPAGNPLDRFTPLRFDHRGTVGSRVRY